ncbi:hypothetical protein OG747_02375 [Streptomyces sp. NBC_01384]|uniref:hypothetical protein n=1 Tax=Streptomyces sp. NBC_01384 TaxID=2903847 RepID=UPI003250F3E7
MPSQHLTHRSADGAVDPVLSEDLGDDADYWDESKNRWITPAGRVPLYIGRSAAHIEPTGSITVR